MDKRSIGSLLDSVAASIDQAHAAQVAALSALRDIAEHQAGYAIPRESLNGTVTEPRLDDDLPAGKGVLSVSEVAAIMHVSDSSVYEIVHQGALPAMRWGRQFRISRRGLMAFMGGLNADDRERLIRETVERTLKDTEL